MIKRIIKYLSPCLLLITGCETDPVIDMPQTEGQIVIEGWIEQDKSVKVLLSNTVPFFSDLDSLTLSDIPVKFAKVTVSNGAEEEILTRRINTDFYPPYVYYSTEIIGKVNQTYNLKVEYQGKTFIANTTIPEPVSLDSAWFQYEPGNDTAGRVWIKFSDNPDQKDYYRVFTQLKGKDSRFIPSYISTISDKVFNGGTIQVGLLKGAGSILQVGENRYFTKGDTIFVRFCTIDKVHFDFWDSVQAEVMTSANPFAASNARIQSNVSEGIGIWGGYGATYYTVIAK